MIEIPDFVTVHGEKVAGNLRVPSARSGWPWNHRAERACGSRNLADGTRSVPATLRRGMTLIELLVVIGIMLLLASIMIPRMRPEMDRSRVRESAREIQLYLSSARNLAMATGRTCGVMIVPLPAEAGCAMQLVQVETPVPYGGDFIGSCGTVTCTAAPSANNNYIANCNIKLSSAPTTISLHPGDMIQFGYQGYSLVLNTSTVIPPGSAGNFTACLDCSHGETPAWLYESAGIVGPYKIWRWPTKSGAAALQLPSPAVIDLTWSGNDPVAGSAPTWWPPNQSGGQVPASTPLMIMFSADGKIDWISNWSSPWGQRVTTPIYLLVGRRDNVFDSPSDPSIANANINQAASLWVAINPTTGLITVSDPGAFGTGISVLMPSNSPPDSRYFARQASANGGK